MAYTAEVVSIQQMTPTVKQFRLRVPGHQFEYEPGQHTTIHFEWRGNEIVHPYTPTGLPRTDQITLAIKVYPDGLASAYMHKRNTGDEITIGELEGNLTLNNTDEDVAFVSTGTGITPMMALLKHYLDEGDGHVYFFSGERKEENIMYHETLEQFAARYENLDLVFSLSDSDWQWDGHIGYIQEHLDEYLDQFDDRDFYVCGVPDMVVDTKEQLRDLGTPDERIFTEGWEDGAVEESDE